MRKKIELGGSLRGGAGMTVKFLYCHTTGYMYGMDGRKFCSEGVYYPIIRENGNAFVFVSEVGVNHVFTKEKYREHFRLAWADEMHYESEGKRRE
jgi:hypothetical protein